MLCRSTKSNRTIGENFLIAKNKKEVKSMRKLLPLIAILAVMSVVPASANAWNRCGGQVSSWSGLYNNWQHQGILGSPKLKSVLRSAGYSPVDGSIKQFMRDRVIVAHTHSVVTIGNYGCGGGQLGSVGAKTLSKGWPIAYVLPRKYSKKDIATRPRKGYHAVHVRARLIAQASCSNPGKATITVTIWVKGHKPPTKVKPKPTAPPAPPTGCNNQTSNNTNSGNACQQNSSSETAKQDATVKNDCDQTHTTNSQQCNTTIIQNITQTTIQVNANCSKVTVFIDGKVQSETFKDSQGNTVTESYCSTTTVTPPPPPPPVDHAPAIACVYPPHMYQGRNGFIWCEASDPDGDLLTVSPDGDSYVHVSAAIPSGTTNDGSACPSGKVCYRATVWADNVTPTGVNAHVTIKVTANGKSDTSNGFFPVLVDTPNWS